MILALCVSTTPSLILGTGAIFRLEDERGDVSEAAILETVRLLLGHGVSTSSKLDDGVTTLMLSTKNPKVVSLLLERGAEINALSAFGFGWTALMYASHYGHVESAKILLRNKADVVVESNDGWNALKLAQAAGHIEIANLLRVANN